MMRTLKGLGALVVLIGLLIGVPVALAMAAGNPIPTAEEFSQALGGVDYGGRFLMGTILPAIGWLAWASFAVSVVIEIVATLRRIGTPRLQTPHIAGLDAQQALAGSLIAAIIALAPAAPVFASTTAAPEKSDPVSITAPAKPAAPSKAEASPGTSDQDQGNATVEHTVVPGDTLSEIAEDRLGDAEQWPELAEATRGTVQPDGRKLEDPDLIYPGWTISVPTEESQSATGGATSSPNRPAATDQDEAPPQAATGEDAKSDRQQDNQAERGTTEPSAAQNDEAESTAPGTTFAPQQASAEDGGGHTAAPDETVADDHDAAAEAIDWRTSGGIGAFLAAGVLAILGLRRTMQRRRRKPGHVVPMPTPEAAQTEKQLKAVADTEGADELDLVLKSLGDWARQTSTTLPEMFCVRVTDDQIALYLATPAQLPDPFQSEADDHTVWTIEPGQIQEIHSTPSAPYPALVTIGQDSTGAQLLLDLEYLGTLGVDGSAELIPEVLDAMAVELATSTWGEELQVTLVGVADGLAAATGTGRVRQIDDLDELLVMLRGRAQATREALDTLGVQNIHEAKTTGENESWMPEIVILGVDPTEEQAAEIRDLAESIPRLGIAAVTAGNALSSQWQLNIHSAETADLAPIGLQLSPQKITPEEATRIISVLTTSLQDPAATATTPPAETLDLDHILGGPHPYLSAVPETTAADEDLTDRSGELEDNDTERYVPTEETQADSARQPSTASEEPATTEEQKTQGADTDAAAEVTDVPETTDEATDEQEQTPKEEEADEPAAIAEEQPAPANSEPEPAPAVPEAVGTSPATPSEEEALDLEAQQLLDDATPQAPVITLLGEVRVIGAAGQAPTSTSSGAVSQTQTARCTALAAFLALNPGAAAEQYHAAFWPNASAEGAKASSNRNKLSNLTRKYLGQDPDGVPYFPPVTTEGYRLDGRVITDWQVIQDLIGHDPVAASTVRLVAAMRLVRGAPFKDVKGRNYSWAEELHQTMIETICDAAHELVTRSLKAGHHNHAQLASKVGRTVDPANESMWRDALISEAAAGNREEVSRLVENLYQYLESFEEGTEPEEETNELIDQLRGRGYRIAS